MNAYYVSISISELQQWLVDEELPVFTDRITHSFKQLDAISSGAELENLFKGLPKFSLDDPAGVLIIEVSGPKTWQVDDMPAIRRLNLSVIRGFIPLTEDARKVLSINWATTIKLSPAIFEPKFIQYRLHNKELLASKAGDLLVNLFISNQKTDFTVNDLFVSALPRALLAAEHKKPDEIKKILGSQFDNLSETWVEYSFGYTRHKPVNRPKSLQSFYDVGLMLSSKYGKEHEIVIKLRDICESPDKDWPEQSLDVVYADEELASLSTDFYIDDTSDDFISLATLALFLRWKQAFHEQRQTVDAFSILEDVKALSEQVEITQVVNALWMLGAYLGMDHVSQICRYANKDNYPALASASIEKEFEAVPAWGDSKLESELDKRAVAAKVIEAEQAGQDKIAKAEQDANAAEQAAQDKIAKAEQDANAAEQAAQDKIAKAEQDANAAEQAAQDKIAKAEQDANAAEQAAQDKIAKAEQDANAAEQAATQKIEAAEIKAKAKTVKAKARVKTVVKTSEVEGEVAKNEKGLTKAQTKPSTAGVKIDKQKIEPQALEDQEGQLALAISNSECNT